MQCICYVSIFYFMMQWASSVGAIFKVPGVLIRDNMVITFEAIWESKVELICFPKSIDSSENPAIIDIRTYCSTPF